MKPTCTTFWQKARRFPPCLVRMLARHPHGRLMLDIEIAQASGLSATEVALIGALMSWDDVPFRAIRPFLKACRCDFETRKDHQRMTEYLRNKPGWLHLRNDIGWQLRWKPLMLQLHSYVHRKPNTTT